jgi:hypothetical protein
VEGVVLQGIRCEVTDLHLVKMHLEVLECHPTTEWRMGSQEGDGDDTVHRSFNHLSLSLRNYVIVYVGGGGWWRKNKKRIEI